MKAVIFTIVTVFTSISSADLSAAISAALQEAGKDHSAKQVALEVSPDQVELAKFKRDQQPIVVEVSTAPGVDRTVYSTKHLADEVEVDDSEDTGIGQELSDNRE